MPVIRLSDSRYDEEAIRVRCERLGVRLLPKNMAALVPIEIESPRVFLDACLIDDDSLVELVWSTVANEKGKKFRHFFNAGEFLMAAGTLDFLTPIYVDANLGDGIRGEDVSKKIFDLGFKNIYLCTGYPAEDFPSMPWLKGIVGKTPLI